MVSAMKTGNFSESQKSLDSAEKNDTSTNSKENERLKNSGLKRMTIALPQETAKMLELLSDLQGITQVEALRRAISTEAYIQHEVKRGARILIETSDNKIKELIFR